MITSKLTSKAQTTVPQAVRVALGLRAGDEIAYQIDGDRVIASRVQRATLVDDPFRTFDEWHSEADMKAYGRI